MGRKVLEREAIARAFVAKVVYDYPTTRSLITALQETPNIRQIFRNSLVLMLAGEDKNVMNIDKKRGG